MPVIPVLERIDPTIWSGFAGFVFEPLRFLGDVVTFVFVLVVG